MLIIDSIMQKGFSIIEVIVASGLLAMALTFFWQLAATSSQHMAAQHARFQAILLLHNAMVLARHHSSATQRLHWSAGVSNTLPNGEGHIRRHSGSAQIKLVWRGAKAPLSHTVITA